MCDDRAFTCRDLTAKRTALLAVIAALVALSGGAAADQAPAKNRQLAIENRYLHLPVKNGAAKVRMKVAVGAETVDEFDIELAPEKPDFWVFLDVARFRGKTATITLEKPGESTAGLASIRQSDDLPDAEHLYREEFRPRFHFSPRRGWNNDPNGLVYHRGEWHLYFQHNPYGVGWGNMHWGHAVSEDLLHWTELPIAIYPRQYGDWVFSGSAVVDAANTGGFKTGSEDVIVAAYTSTGRGEVIAYSNDRGRTFSEYPGNPVVKHAGRDPKLLWYAPGRHWVMAVYDERDQSRGIAFHTSPDLKTWTFASRIEGYFECPEIFELPLDGDQEKALWVVYAADGEYAVGRFDGKRFTPRHEGKNRFNWGNCFYASQTFNNVPESDGRRIQIAWGKVGHPAMSFNQQMLFPVELSLRTTPEGPRLFAQPVREIERLHAKSIAWDDRPIGGAREETPINVESGLLRVRAEIELGSASQVGFVVRGVPVVYDVGKKVLSCERQSAPLELIGGRITLEILVDCSTIEIFAGGGRVYMPIGKTLPTDNHSLSVFAKGGAAVVRSLRAYELRSAVGP